MNSILSWIGYAFFSLFMLIFWIIWFFIKLAFTAVAVVIILFIFGMFFWGFSSKNKYFGAVSMRGQNYESFKSFGKTSLEDVSIDGTLKVMGQFKGCNIKVKDETKITGQTKIEKSEFLEDVSVFGKMELISCTVKGSVKVFGKAKFIDCQLNDVYATAEKLKFKSGQVKNIYVKINRKWCWHSHCYPVVKLDGTTVEGDITFDSGNGKVVLENGAVVKGKVVGGRIG